MRNKVAMLLACVGFVVMVVSEFGLAYQLQVVCLFCNALGLVATMASVLFVRQREKDEKGNFFVFYLVCLGNLVLSPYFIMTIAVTISSHQLPLFRDWYWQVIVLLCFVLIGTWFRREAKQPIAS